MNNLREDLDEYDHDLNLNLSVGQVQGPSFEALQPDAAADADIDVH